MKKLLSFIGSDIYTSEYKSREDLTGSILDLGFDGIELVRCGEDESKIDHDLIQGVHLPFYTSWIDYEEKREEALLREFASWEEARKFFAFEPGSYWEYFLSDLDFAESWADYTVFHVANVASHEYLSQDYHVTSEEVIDGSVRVINKLLKGRDESNLFLLENLYFPGLSLTDPRQADYLLENINYKNLGFMVDTGHLMCTNTSLRTEDEAWDYLIGIVRSHGSLKDYFKGVHLHASVTGHIQEALRQGPPSLSPDFLTRFKEIYDYVSLIDTHQPALSPKVNQFLDLVAPDYLVFELKYENRRDLEAKARRQALVLTQS